MLRAVRLGLAAVGGLAVLIAALVATAVYLHPNTQGPWAEFSIGPGSGEAASISRGVMRASGITVKGLLATAYDTPAVRVIGPPWLSRTRYSVTALVERDKADSFAPLLRRELESRFRLQTHVEPHTFDVFVLTAIAPRLEVAQGSPMGTWFQPPTARLTSATSQRIATAVEYIVGTPVIDETGLRGTYDLTLEWADEPVESITAELRHRFGLALTPARRDLDALIVDRIHRDPALLLLAQTGRLTRPAPASIRNRIARALSLR